MAELFANIDPRIISILLALGFGAVIGLEREIVIQRTGVNDFGGVRTYSFIGLLGALSGLLAEPLSPFFTIAAFMGVLFLIAIAYFADRTHRKDKIGMTGEITALISFTTGLLSALGLTYLALVTTIAVITVLSLRRWLHGFAKGLENEEIYASVKFGIIAFIVLPLLPDKTFDPWGVLNPHKIWFLIVLISGVTFLGYILSKVLGARKGTALTGFVGGIVSSTAVNLSMAQRSKERSVPIPALVMGSLLAQASSFMITGFEIFLLNKELFRYVIIPLSLGIIFILGYTLLHRHQSGKQKLKKEYQVNLKSPFTLSQALILGGILTGILLVTKILNEYIGGAGLYVTGAFSSLISLDATAIAISEVAGESVSYLDATRVLMLGVVMSIVSKCIVLWTVATREFAWKMTLFFLIICGLLIGFAWVV